MITKQMLDRVITIAVNRDGLVTHAFQATSYGIFEDGIEISRQSSAQENVDPAVLGETIPDQAALLSQLAALQCELDNEKKVRERADAVIASLEADLQSARSRIIELTPVPVVSQVGADSTVDSQESSSSS